MKTNATLLVLALVLAAVALIEASPHAAASELAPEAKNAISHRGKALRKLATSLQG